jgi:hypothetical protein
MKPSYWKTAKCEFLQYNVNRVDESLRTGAIFRLSRPLTLRQASRSSSLGYRLTSVFTKQVH